MAPSCAVAVCNDRTKRHFFRFPKTPKIRTLWIEACHRTDDVNADNSLICSNHFLPEDFKRDLKNELLNLPLIKRLNEGVIPTQRLTLQQNTKLSEDKLYKSERNNRAKKRLLDDSALETDPKCSRYSKDLPHISESTSSLSLSSHQKIDKYTNTDDDLDTELVHEVMTLREQVAELSGIRVNHMIQIREIKQLAREKNKEMIKLKDNLINKTKVISELKEKLDNQSQAIKILRNALVTLKGKAEK